MTRNMTLLLKNLNKHAEYTRKIQSLDREMGEILTALGLSDYSDDAELRERLAIITEDGEGTNMEELTEIIRRAKGL